MKMFYRANSVLLIIDMQEKLTPHMAGAKMLVAGARVLAQFAQLVKIPVIMTEQYPEGIGPTVPEVKSVVGPAPVIGKRTFSCCREAKFLAELERTGRKQVLIAGIETHVCVYQTAADLVERGYQVQVAADAVSSRTEANKNIGLERIRTAGAGVTSVESAVFELLETSACPEFKATLKLIK